MNIIWINKNIQNLKTLVTNVKHKRLVRKFAQNFKAIPEEVETRFNSIYRMIKVFLQVYNDLKTSTIDRDLQLKLVSIDEKMMRDIAIVLEMFDRVKHISNYTSCYSN